MHKTQVSQRLTANERMRSAVSKIADKQAAQLAQQEIERSQRAARLADQAEVRAGFAETMALAKDRAEEVEETDYGATRILSRDGLLWLQRKGRISGGNLSAALKWRELTHAAAITGLGSSSPERTGGTRSTPLTMAKHEATEKLIAGRRDGLHGDQGLILLMEEVAGKGATIRDLAHGEQDLAISLEAQFNVACRLLARHWGLSS